MIINISKMLISAGIFKTLMSILLIAVFSSNVFSEPIVLTSGPHLFFDDHLIDSKTNLERVINSPTQRSEPIITGKEDDNFQPYLTVIRDAETEKFRMWYNIPRENRPSNSFLAYIESEDGVNWIRPHQVQVRYRSDNDPMRIKYGASVIDDGVDFPDPERRFKFGWFHRGGTRIAVSPGGIEWTPISEEVLVPHDHDITAIFRDPIRNRYAAFISTRTTGETWTDERRIPIQSVSDDLINWREPWRIFEPDDQDEGETQFYGMSGVIARGDLLIGMLKVLRDDVIAEGAPDGAYGIGYTALTWSRDGETWSRFREPFLDRNPEKGTWDYAMAWADCQLLVGDEVFIYYGGYAWGHKHERLTERQIGLARMPKDRYVSLSADENRGSFRTPILTLNAEKMTINAIVEGGMQVRILDASDKPIHGFDWTDCRVIKGDSIAHSVVWRREISELKDKEIRLEFALRRTKLFGFKLFD